MPIKILHWVMAAVLFASMANAQTATDAVAPESATRQSATPESATPESATLADIMHFSDQVTAALASRNAGKPATAKKWMVVAAHPLAVEAGAKILESGGTAADAMVAVQAVLGLVEPQSSGLGGGAFLVWYDAKTGELITLDGRETAPLAADPTLFQIDGEPMRFWAAVIGGRSVGTPGTPMLMQVAHDRWGNTSWADLFQPAIDWAEKGFVVSPRLASAVAKDQERLATYPRTAAYFLPDGVPIAVGAVLRNSPYAATLRAIADKGAKVFYAGDIAQDIVHTVQNATGIPVVCPCLILPLIAWLRVLLFVLPIAGLMSVGWAHPLRGR